MDNIKIHFSGKKLVLEIDTEQRLYKTEKGNQMIATTHGFKDVYVEDDTLKLSLNLIKK